MPRSQEQQLPSHCTVGSVDTCWLLTRSVKVLLVDTDAVSPGTGALLPKLLPEMRYGGC